MASFEGKEEGIQAGKIFAPTGKAVASDDQRLLELSIQLRRKLGVDELGERFSVQL